MSGGHSLSAGASLEDGPCRERRRRLAEARFNGRRPGGRTGGLSNNTASSASAGQPPCPGPPPLSHRFMRILGIAATRDLPTSFPTAILRNQTDGVGTLKRKPVEEGTSQFRRCR